MKGSRTALVDWLTPKLAGTTTQALLLEPDQDWTPPCWRLHMMDEQTAFPGHWLRLVQLDYYREDGDTVTALDDCQKLLNTMGFNEPQSRVLIPRTDAPGPMELVLLGGNSWRQQEAPEGSPMYRHFVLSLELVYGKPKP